MDVLLGAVAGIITFFIERDSSAWKLDGSLEIIYCIYAGILESAVVTYVQAWCISKRGPVFTATFNPLSTVIATILGVIILHEDLYAGSLGGAIAVAVGLYIVLWGKAEEVQTERGRDHRTTMYAKLTWRNRSWSTRGRNGMVNCIPKDSRTQQQGEERLRQPCSHRGVHVTSLNMWEATTYALSNRGPRWWIQISDAWLMMVLYACR